jgi:alpha-tubulin suppressor-like RCC1 family protein
VAIDIAAGDQHTCALLGSGSVQCWGTNFVGQLGHGNTVTIGDDELPSSVSTVDVGAPVTRIATGHWHTCALLDIGSLRCWGAGDDGRLGYGNTSDIGDNEAPQDAGDVPIF